MNIVDEYRNRIRKATNLDEKKAIAAELHQLANTFDEVQRSNYEQAMQELRSDIVLQLEVIDPISRRAEAILSRYSSVAKG
ncbi:hypothetical protein GO730_12655 [Spirosoma sp. HMF3257]|uniref:Uncharacterized protein n=1 Tax=Spirosoma telluris TaxID=2183553 RepID=A0A327NHN3_9BACT|nr:hypothetical protein [Spirosoma telluris]RAI74861.1 hypothetical protein HMF3257_12565 [Spirosoma telluris]